MKRKFAIRIVACLLGGVIWVVVVRHSEAPRKPAVLMALQTVSMTNTPFGYRPMAVLVVTNAGRKPVFLDFDRREFLERDGWQSYSSRPIPISFASCSVPPGTNCLVSIRWPYRDRPWRVGVTVFEPSKTLEKVKVAGERLWSRVARKVAYTNFWFSDLISPVYEITGPELPGISQLPSPLGGWAMGFQEKDPNPWSPDYDWLNADFDNAEDPPMAPSSIQPDAAPGPSAEFWDSALKDRYR